MRLDRNENESGKGKYALVRLRGIEAGSEAHSLLKRLYELGHLDWGIVGQPDEFFVIKLRDKYADKAITAYADAVMDDAPRQIDAEKYKSLVHYALDIQRLSGRAGLLSEFCKDPD